MVSVCDWLWVSKRPQTGMLRSRAARSGLWVSACWSGEARLHDWVKGGQLGVLAGVQMKVIDPSAIASEPDPICGRRVLHDLDLAQCHPSRLFLASVRTVDS